MPDDIATTPGRRLPWTLALAAFVSSYDRFVMAPLLLVIAADLDVSVGAVAAVTGGYYLAYGLAQPLWGALADSRGRVTALRWGLAGGVVAGLASAVAPNLTVLAVTRIVAGGCFSGVIPCVLVYVGDSWPAHVRQRPLSDVLAATAIGTTAGTLGTGLVAQVGTWRTGLAVSALAAAGVVAATRTLSEPARPGAVQRPLEALRRVLSARWARVLVALTFVEGVVVVAPFPYLATALQAEGLSVAAAGAAAGTLGVGVLVGSRVVKVSVGRVSDAQLITLGGAVILLGWGVLFVSITLGTMLVAALILGAGWASFHSTMQSWATDVVPVARATAVSLFVAALFSGAACGALLVAPLVDRHAFGTVFLAALALTAPLTATTAIARSRYARKDGPNPAAPRS